MRRRTTVTCKDEPFESYCDPALCVLAKFGIGQDAPDAPGWWSNDHVVGTTFALYGCERYTDTAFDRAVAEPNALATCLYGAMAFMPPTTKPHKWQQMVNSLMSQATYIDVPEELTIAGQFKDLLEAYCTSNIRAMAPEEILMNKPWTDAGTTKFKLEVYLSSYTTDGSTLQVGDR